MRYFFIDNYGEEIELQFENGDEDVTIFGELNRDISIIKWENFVGDVLYELSITDATPWGAVISVINHYDNTYSSWEFDGELSLDSASHFRDYCNEQCGTCLTIDQAYVILCYGV